MRPPTARMQRSAVLPAAWLVALLLAAAGAGCASGGGGADGGPDAGDGVAGPDGSAADGGADAAAADGDTAADDDAPAYPPPRPALIPLDGQILFPVQLDDRPATYQLVVDSGAFGTAVHEPLVRELENGVGRVSIDFGHGLRLVDQRVLAADLSKAEDHIGVALHGLIGQDIIQHHFFGLDYRRAEVTMAAAVPPVPPPGFAAADAVAVPYALEQLMPVVEATLDGQPLRLVADTGSGVTLVTESLVAADTLAAGAGGYVWHTSYGSDPATLVRLGDLRLGGLAVADSWAAVIPDEHHLKPVLDSLGVAVDGFVGYPVYRRCYLAICGPESRYLCYPYPDRSHIDRHEWDRVGIELRRQDEALLIDMVFSPSDAAAQGLAPEDELLAIDGQAVAGRPLDDLRRALRGQPGESRSLRLARDPEPIEIEVAVDRLLEPLPTD